MIQILIIKKINVNGDNIIYGGYDNVDGKDVSDRSDEQVMNTEIFNDYDVMNVMNMTTV